MFAMSFHIGVITGRKKKEKKTLTFLEINKYQKYICENLKRWMVFLACVEKKDKKKIRAKFVPKQT